MGNCTNCQPKQSAEEAGRVHDQAMFQVNDEDYAKIYDQDESEKISNIGRRFNPTVHTYCKDGELNNPKAYFARVPIFTRLEEKIIFPREGNVAFLACGLTEMPCDGQDIREIIYKPSSKPSEYYGYNDC